MSTHTIPGDIKSYRGFAAEALMQAIHDMKMTPPDKDRKKGGSATPKRYRWVRFASAVVWLGSRDATPYFDLVRVDQLAALQALGWKEYARDCLEKTSLGCISWRVTPSERELLERGIAALGG